MTRSVAVIGGGIVGIACAEWLRRYDFAVTLIDRVAAGDEHMTSYGNAGILAAAAVIPVPTPSIFGHLPFYLLSKKSPLLVRRAAIPGLFPWLLSYLRNAAADKVRKISTHLTFLLHDAVQQHQALARGTAAESFIKTSDYYYLFGDEKKFNAESFAWRLRAENGYGGEALDSDALHALDPNLSDAYSFAWRFPGHGYISDPGAYVKALHAHFIARGGVFRFGEVSDIISKDGKAEIMTDNFSDIFDSCVIAGGVHSETLARKLGLRLRLEKESGYHIWVKNPSFMPPAPMMLNDGKCAMTPMRGGLRLAGLVEFGGAEKFSPRAVDFLLTHLHRAYPHLRYDSLRVWRGHRPATPDSLPHLGVHPRYDNIFFACGHQHVGLTAAAKSGYLLARLLRGDAVNYDLSVFAPDRFSKTEFSKTIAFSR